MADKREDLTPMMGQYCDLCAEYDDALVLFQVGDFYEAFCEAAETIAPLLDITLTQREDSTGTWAMAGIPMDNAASYIETLLDADYRVAIADQVEDPDEVTGVVERAVTRVVTPGTVLADELLGVGTSNYVASVASDGEQFGLAMLDVATGEFKATGGERATVAAELERLAPAELLAGPGVDADAFAVDAMRPPAPDDAFDDAAASERIERHVGTPDTLLDGRAEKRACGAALAYAEYTQGGPDGVGHVTRLARYDPREHALIDATARRSLELFEPRDATGDDTTLFDVIDDTVAAVGRRRLAQWLRRPPLDATTIERRHEAVEELVEGSLVRAELREALDAVYDLERLTTRVSRERADARDLRALEQTLDAVPAVAAALADCAADWLGERREALDPLDDVRSLIGDAIQADPPAEITEGGVIADDYDEELDRLRATEREGREWVESLEASEQERTGIDSLSVGYNEVHGYYIEVTNPNLDRVPDDYTRRQTLKNSERFYTPELKAREDEILGASERADAREHDLFCEVRREVAEAADRLRTVADALAALDAVAALAAVAVERDYVRPTIGADRIAIDGGRHPVVETTVDAFVPNDAAIGAGAVTIITGPNMSGKSTYMRQVALIQLLAQIGAFVPADAARLPIVDRVFTRVGASDDIAGGHSTFMREMAELTEILHNATPDSLVLLDEVGRGTSTADGLAIARAVTEFIHDDIGARTLFATHYHELTDVADDLERVENRHFSADRDGESVTFHHVVRDGPAAASYGVAVARMAGIPEPVVERSAALVEDGDSTATAADGTATPRLTPDALTPAGTDEGGAAERLDEGAGGRTDESKGGRTDENATTTAAPDGEPASPEATRDHSEEAVLDELRELSIAETTPLEALQRLSALQETLDGTD
jgi:DNA mismatch repair protein MutS